MPIADPCDLRSVEQRVVAGIDDQKIVAQALVLGEAKIRRSVMVEFRVAPESGSY